MVKCESFKVEDSPERYLHTAQIYNDFLYVLGGSDRAKSSKRPWRFDISN